MATIQGTNGAYSAVSGFNGKLTSFSSDTNITTVETTGFGDGGYEVHEPAKVGLTGSATGTPIFDVANSQPIPSTLLAATAGLVNAKGAMTLTLTTACTLSFTGVMRRVGLGMEEGGKGDLAHDFTSSGAITIAWDETP